MTTSLSTTADRATELADGEVWAALSPLGGKERWLPAEVTDPDPAATARRYADSALEQYGPLPIRLGDAASAQWQDTVATLQERSSAVAAARDALNAAQEALAAALTDYDRGIGGVVTAEVDRVRDERRHARWRIKEQERAAEAARKAAEEAPLDAQYGPRQFTTSIKRMKTGRYSWESIDVITVHRESCRHATGYQRDLLRADEVLVLVTERNAQFCGACRAEKMVRAAYPAASPILDAHAEARQHARRPMQQGKIHHLLKTADVSRLSIDSQTGFGYDGYKIENYGPYVRLTWNHAGSGRVTFDARELQPIYRALTIGGYHCEPVEKDERNWRNEPLYSEVRVTRMSAADEATARQAGADLLWNAFQVGIPSAEAVLAFSAGELTADSVATLMALRADTK